MRCLTALIEREENGYVAICPEFDIASQGDTIEEARANLTEALTLFFETADASEGWNRNRSRRAAQCLALLPPASSPITPPSASTARPCPHCGGAVVVMKRFTAKQLRRLSAPLSCAPNSS
jgi:predicted RNase H-like HicB family nuclease